MSDSTATELGRFPLRLTGANNALAVLAVTPREFSSARCAGSWSGTSSWSS
jgi:hypothetical protein